MNGTIVHSHHSDHCVLLTVPDAREAPVLVEHFSSNGDETTSALTDSQAIQLLDALRERYGETEVRT